MTLTWKHSFGRGQLRIQNVEHNPRLRPFVKTFVVDQRRRARGALHELLSYKWNTRRESGLVIRDPKQEAAMVVRFCGKSMSGCGSEGHTLTCKRMYDHLEGRESTEMICQSQHTRTVINGRTE